MSKSCGGKINKTGYDKKSFGKKTSQGFNNGEEDS